MNETDYEDAVVSFYESLYAFGYSLSGNEDDASELTQETFYRLLTKGAMVHDSSKVKSWLFTTLHLIFLGWEQRRVRLPHFEISGAENQISPVTPEQLDVLLHNAVRDSLLEVEDNKLGGRTQSEGENMQTLAFLWFDLPETERRPVKPLPNRQ